MSSRRAPKKAKIDAAEDITSQPKEVLMAGNQSEVASDEEVSDYERVRLENMRRNAEFLSTLGLDAVRPVAETGGPTKAPSKKGVTKRKPVSQLPIRRSGRVTIERLKVEIETAEGTDKEEKQALLDEMVSKKSEGSYEAAIAGEFAAKERLADLQLPMSNSLNGPDEEVDRTIWHRQLVNSLTDNATPTKQQTMAVAADYTKRINSLNIAQDDVAKLTENRITSVWLHPSPHKVVAAAGDKEGNIGIWDVDHKDGATEGIYKYRPHVENVCKLHSWPQDPSKLYSVSYDGTIRYLDLEKEAFSLAFVAPEGLYDLSILDASFNSDGHTAYAGRSDGKVSLIDFRSKRCGASAYEFTFQAHESSRVNSVQQHTTDPNLVISTAGGTGGAISIYDIRKASSNNSSSSSTETKKSLKPLHQLALHSKSINAAYISPNGKYIVSVSQDNTVRTWTDFATPGAKPTSTVTKHDNHTGRWLSTFRPAFDPKSETAFVLGSMTHPRIVEVFNPTTSSTTGVTSLNVLAVLKGDFLGSVCSRNCFHASLDVVAGGNSSGRVHIFR